jgi:hypothetical protein
MRHHETAALWVLLDAGAGEEAVVGSLDREVVGQTVEVVPESGGDGERLAQAEDVFGENRVVKNPQEATERSPGVGPRVGTNLEFLEVPPYGFGIAGIVLAVVAAVEPAPNPREACANRLPVEQAADARNRVATDVVANSLVVEAVQRRCDVRHAVEKAPNVDGCCWRGHRKCDTGGW